MSEQEKEILQKPEAQENQNQPEVKRIDPVAILWTFGKCLTALLPVYLAGYYRLSGGLVVCGLALYSGWKHTREAKEARLRSAMQLLNQEHEDSSGSFKYQKDLPAWVNFPNVEKVEWLNKVIQQAWPYIGQYLEKLLTESIAPSIRASSAHLQTLSFTKIDFGNKAMKVVGVKAHTENDKGQVLLDVYISYVGDVEINVEVKRYFCKAGVKGIQLNGMMRVILEPLIGDVPIVGAVTMFFIQRPKLIINWTGLTNLLDIPGLNTKSDTMIMDAIAAFLVLPNRLTIPLVGNLPVAQLRSPLPRGVVRIHLLEADNLAAKDNAVKGIMSGFSDPYAVIRVGPQTFKSQHKDNTLSPKWEEMYEVTVHEVPGQELEVEVYDKDPDQDDFLGRVTLDLGIVKKANIVDEWFTLKDTPSGRVHLRMEWLSLHDNTDQLEDVLKKNATVQSKTTNPPSAAILTVYLDKAEELPLKKGNKEPSPMAQLSVQDTTRDSRTCWNTVNPVWEDAFTFFIQDPNKQDINIQVKDHDRVQSLGSLSIPISRLLSCPQLRLDEWFQLNQSGKASRVHIHSVLRVLLMNESATSTSLLSSSPGSSRAQHTTPHPSFATEGVLRIHLLEGQNLIPKDNLLGGLKKGKSDPYVVINIGGSTFKSGVIKENLNPSWNEMYEVVLTDLPGQDVSLEVFDKDMDMTDDFMGRLKIKLSDIIKTQHLDEWFTLQDVKHGRVHMTLEWLPKVTQSDKLQQVLHYQSKSSFLNKTVPAVALLFVYLEAAHDLPLKKSGKEPKVGAELVLGKKSYKTTVCDRTSSPQWNEAFYFLVHDPNKEQLIVKLSHNWDFSLGSVEIPVRDLLSQPELLLDQWLNLHGASPESQILLRAELKILCPKMTQKPGEQIKTPIVEKSSVKGSEPEKETVQKLREPLIPVTITSSVIAPEKTMEKETEKEKEKKTEKEKEKKTEKEKEKETEKSANVPEVIGPVDVDPLHTSPDPAFGTEGVLRIQLVQAENLIAKDNMMGGMVKGKSDPYVNISIGNSTFKSQVIKENLNPIWNEMYELVLTPAPATDVLVEVFDKDIDKDDFLGRFHVGLTEIIQATYIDQWFTLENVKHGRLHLILEWLPTETQPDKLQQALQLQSMSFKNKTVPAAGLLFVLVERARGLSMVKGGKEPKAGAELVLSGTSYKTKVCERTTTPQWGEAFHFLIHNPREDILVLKLSSGWDQPLGSLVLPMKELLTQPQLVLDQWKNLDGGLAESQILLRAQLKILASKMDIKVEKPTEKSAEMPTEKSTDQQFKSPVEIPGEKPFDKPIEKPAEKLPEKPSSANSLSGGQSTGKPSVSAEQTPSAASKDIKQETKPTPRLNELVASTIQGAVSLPEDKPRGPDVSHDTKDLSNTTMGGIFKTAEPVPKKESPSATNKEQTLESASDKSHEKIPITIPATEDKKDTTHGLPQQHTSPDPGFGTQGVLRIHLLEAQNLVAMDSLMGGMVKGKSDPYVKTTVGNTTFKSHVIKETLNPTWNEMYEMILSPDSNLEVKFELYDKDIDSDDFLGRFKTNLGDIMKFQYNDEWFTLSDVKHGRLHLVLEWLPTVTQSDKLQQILHMQSVQTYQNKVLPSVAMLYILIDRAHALPLKKSGKEPKAGAELVLGGTSYKTKVCDRTNSPQWHEEFQFLVNDPYKDMLIIKLSSGWDQPMGSLILPIKELLSKPELLLDKWMNLDGALPESQILLRAQLKVLNSKMAALMALGAGPVLSNKQAATTGQIKITLAYQKKFTVIIHACRGLVSSSKEGLDTYVSLILLPDKSKATKKKTSVKKKDLNPEFNEKFEFDMSVDDVRQRVLSVCVKHSSSFMSRDKDVIGQVEIDLGQVDNVGVTEWFDLKEDSN